MRLWTLHPYYLDTPGLLALWRETLLARSVFQGKTKGYQNHPQLIRFQKTSDPQAYLELYLNTIFEESLERGFNFNPNKLASPSETIEKSGMPPISVTQGQVDYEWQHLLQKLSRRNPAQFKKFQDLRKPLVNPIFKVIPGPIEPWEKFNN
jgi:hypothetical protein